MRYQVMVTGWRYTRWWFVGIRYGEWWIGWRKDFQADGWEINALGLMVFVCADKIHKDRLGEAWQPTRMI